MFPVNYRPPEHLPPHHRDFPPRTPAKHIEPHFHADGSGALALMVAFYLVAMFTGLGLLGTFASEPNITSAEIMARH